MHPTIDPVDKEITFCSFRLRAFITQFQEVEVRSNSISWFSGKQLGFWKQKVLNSHYFLFMTFFIRTERCRFMLRAARMQVINKLSLVHVYSIIEASHPFIPPLANVMEHSCQVVGTALILGNSGMEPCLLPSRGPQADGRGVKVMNRNMAFRKCHGLSKPRGGWSG